MRRKKRYLLLKTIPSDMPKNCEFIFQNKFGYVFRVDPKNAEMLRKNATFISGSIRKIKAIESKSPKSKVPDLDAGMK